MWVTDSLPYIYLEMNHVAGFRMENIYQSVFVAYDIVLYVLGVSKLSNELSICKHASDRIDDEIIQVEYLQTRSTSVTLHSKFIG